MHELFIIVKLGPLIRDRTDKSKKTAQLRRELSAEDIISEGGRACLRASESFMNIFSLKMTLVYL
jgi:hypothetical protein